MRPNIFNIATSELSQDAFLAWLIQWADPSNREHDPNLHNCAQDFVRLLISCQHEKDIKEIVNVKAGTQWEHIDIWAEIYTSTNNFILIIEDKVFASERRDQLIAYRKIAEEYGIENNLIPVCIYLKTGSEPERTLSQIRAKRYATVSRFHLLSLFEKHGGITNQIFKDYLECIQELEASHQAYQSLPIGKWDGFCWQGFYQCLEKEAGLEFWGIVNSPGGNSFWNGHFPMENWNGFPVYLQIEEGDLCFKIATHPDDIDFEGEFNRGQKRNEWHRILATKAGEAGYLDICRPERFGSGDYMTCALIYKENWLGPNQEIVDKQAVLRNLKKYKEFLLACL